MTSREKQIVWLTELITRLQPIADYINGNAGVVFSVGYALGKANHAAFSIGEALQSLRDALEERKK